MPAKSGFSKADLGAPAFFDDLVPEGAGIAVKPMFGHRGAFVNGTMFMGVFGDRVLVRLAEADRPKLLAEEGATHFEPMPGRRMGEYVLLPLDWIDDPSQAQPWVTRALAYARTVPPKKKPAPKTKAAPKKAPPKKKTKK